MVSCLQSTWESRTGNVSPVAFRVWTQCTVRTGKKSKHPRGMVLVTRMAALQAEEQGTKLNSILECKPLTDKEHHELCRYIDDAAHR
jgi:hypothetical protein